MTAEEDPAPAADGETTTAEEEPALVDDENGDEEPPPAPPKIAASPGNKKEGEVSSSMTSLEDVEVNVKPTPEGHKVEVFDPQQHGKGRKRYTSYCVLVRNTKAGGKVVKAAVRRRYSAFQWLYRKLTDERPGAAVPILPHRRAPRGNARFADDLIAYRRETAQKWLNRVLVHPELYDAACLMQFLGAKDGSIFEDKATKDDGEDGATVEAGGSFDEEDGGGSDDEDGDAKSVKSKTSTISPKRAEGDDMEQDGALRGIKNFATKFSAKLASYSHADVVKSPEEYTFVRCEEWGAMAETNVRDVGRQIALLTLAHRASGKELEAMAMRFGRAGVLNYPVGGAAESKLLSDVFNTAGTSAAGAAKTEADRADRLVRDIYDEKDTGDGRDPVHELLDDIQSFRIALQQRRELQAQAHVLANRIDAQKTNLETVKAYPSNRAVNRAMQARMEKEHEEKVTRAIERSVAGKELFEECSERVKREAERFRVEFQVKVCKIVRTLAELQMEFNAKAGEGWGELQGSMEYMEVVKKEEEEQKGDSDGEVL